MNVGEAHMSWDRHRAQRAAVAAGRQGNRLHRRCSRAAVQCRLAREAIQQPSVLCSHARLLFLAHRRS